MECFIHDASLMVIKPVLVQPNELIYCPFHRKWEVYMGEDPALCDWCCQFDPCPMHGSNSDGLGYDPFYVDDEEPEMDEVQRERFERIKAKRGTKEREDLIRRIAEDKVMREKGTVPRSLEPNALDALDAVDLDDL